MAQLSFMLSLVIYNLVVIVCPVCIYRYVATAVTSVHEMENGFNIWSFNGKLLYRTLKDHFFQVRCITLVTACSL